MAVAQMRRKRNDPELQQQGGSEEVDIELPGVRSVLGDVRRLSQGTCTGVQIGRGGSFWLGEEGIRAPRRQASWPGSHTR